MIRNKGTWRSQHRKHHIKPFSWKIFPFSNWSDELVWGILFGIRDQNWLKVKEVHYLLFLQFYARWGICEYMILLGFWQNCHQSWNLDFTFLFILFRVSKLHSLTHTHVPNRRSNSHRELISFWPLNHIITTWCRLIGTWVQICFILFFVFFFNQMVDLRLCRLFETDGLRKRKKKSEIAYKSKR